MRATLQKTETGYGLKEMVAFVSSVRPEHKHHKLSLKNCQAIELGYDLEELAESFTEHSWDGDSHNIFKAGFQKALEILGDKKFTEKDMLKAFIAGAFTDDCSDLLKLLSTLQQTEWDVEVEMEENCPYDYSNRCTQGRCDCIRPKLDADGCIILKRV